MRSGRVLMHRVLHDVAQAADDLRLRILGGQDQNMAGPVDCPTKPGWLAVLGRLAIIAAIRRLLGRQARDGAVDRMDELSYLLDSGSDRIGALDFQASATDYVPRAAIGSWGRCFLLRSSWRKR